METAVFSTPLDELNYGKAYRNLFEKKKMKTVGDVLAFPPKKLLVFDGRKNPDSILYSYAGLIVKAFGISAPDNKPYIFINARDWSGHVYKIMTYEKKWKNILTSILASKTDVQIIVYGMIRPDFFTKRKASSVTQKSYFISASFIEFYSPQNAATPIYFTNSSDNEKMQKLVADLNEKLIIKDTLDDYFPEEYPALDRSLKWLHNPPSFSNWVQGINRYLISALVYYYVRRDNSSSMLLSYEKDAPTALPESTYQDVKLYFDLDQTQIDAINAVVDMAKSPSPDMMYVLGDVGAGKSVVAYSSAYAIIKAHLEANPKSDVRVVLLAPTILLANQHYRTFTSYYPDMAEHTALVTGATKGRKHEKAHMLIGTHALLGESDTPCQLLIVDEPQKFGIQQQKWLSPTHYLFLTATPLPRWTALLLSEDVRSMQINARPRDVTLVPLKFSEDKLRYVLTKLPADKPKLIVVPKIESEDAYPNLREMETILAEMNIEHATVHGKMKPEDVESEMERFREGKVTTLLATTVVESGIDIQELKYLIVLAPEFYGYLNLYQLTGRVGRNGDNSFVYLLTYAEDKIKEYSDKVKNGYDASKLDLNIRGSGKMDDTEQSGIIKIPKGEFISDEVITEATRIYKVLKNNLTDLEKVEKELEPFFDMYF